MIVDKNFLKSVASQGKHTFISTGMSTKKILMKQLKFLEIKMQF